MERKCGNPALMSHFLSSCCVPLSRVLFSSQRSWSLCLEPHSTALNTFTSFSPSFNSSMGILIRKVVGSTSWYFLLNSQSCGTKGGGQC
ncbi:hypothetical protein BDQ94DRAFT_149063 [Aspergillus welwitschiae]|uniref:Uncharacterized protein n=1 Tax=Aspergillus welwitschiae TaxID=1341132 RepID=A0A3F3PUL3_9EURO|nr:hypothetical protein BDQ94DRAFT_149063 [Aspergillus welwitschiae]RDH30442.1 hypothetical protein BDQ94DRAFT_149063 [Aspergillus welwitschiae]